MQKILNENLVGVSGKKEIEINAYGREIREISKQPSKKGIDVNEFNFKGNREKIRIDSVEKSIDLLNSFI